MNNVDRSKLLFNIVSDLDEGEFTIRKYSGRCMYGTNCIGIVCDNQFKLIASMLECLASKMDYDLYIGPVCNVKNELFEFSDIIKNAQIDNMGLRSIVYFPQMKWLDEFDDDLDDDLESNEEG